MFMQSSLMNLMGSLLQNSQEIAKVRKLEKIQLCNNNFIPPYNENILHTGMDIGGEDTIGMKRSSGMSTIIKSTPTAVPYMLLKARALSNLYCTLQTIFIMKFIAELEHFHHKALN